MLGKTSFKTWISGKLTRGSLQILCIIYILKHGVTTWDATKSVYSTQVIFEKSLRSSRGTLGRYQVFKRQYIHKFFLGFFLLINNEKYVKQREKYNIKTIT